MIGNRFYTWFKNYYQWVGGAFSETLLLPLVRATAGLRAGAIRYDETTNTVETYDGTNWNPIPSATGFVPNSRTITINGTTFDLSTNRIYSVGTVTSVGLSMPAAFTVSGSPVTGSGTLSVAGAGLASQYVRGDGTLANFPTTQGGGSSVSYYLNGSVNQGTFGGATYYEINRTPVLGAGTNFSRNTDGYIASFITDANDPALTEIPGGNFNLELYFSASSGGGNPSFYVELYKYDGTNFSLIASNSTSPDSIVGATKDAYFTALAVPQTALNITDRLAIRVYVNTSGRTITLHTEDQNLCQVITTFSTGINTINGLTKQVQFLTTGTSGTDFNINSTNSTHTFNIPTASATNRGALSSADWTTFNDKIGGSGVSGQVAYFDGTKTITGESNLFWDASADRLGVGNNAPAGRVGITGTDLIGLHSEISTVSGTSQNTIGVYSKNTTNAFGFAAVFEEATPNTTGGQFPVQIIHSLVSGTAQAGMNTGMWYSLPDDAGNLKEILHRVWTTNASAASYSNVHFFETWFNGVRRSPLFIHGNGIGIGPGLNVESSVHVRQRTNDHIGGIKQQRASGGNTYTTFVKSDNSYNLEYAETASGSPTNLMTVTSTGNFLLGTTIDNTADRLQVSGSVAISSIPARTTAASIFLTTDTNQVRSRTASEVLTDIGGVPTSRTLTINGTAFDLSANRSWSVGTVTSVGLTSSTSGVTITDSPVTVSGSIGIAIATANGSQQGLLSSTDWTTFNNKQNTLSLTTTGTSGAATLIGATLNVPQYQAQGNYITSLTGEATASGPGAASVTLSTTAVTSKLLTGLNLSGGGTIAATDSILTAFGKVQNQISAMVGGVMYQGTWNASTNTPTLTSSVGVKGYYYIVDVSGTTSLNGISDWRVGDWAIFNGSTWDKVDNTDAVSSVNGFTGAVSLTTSHIAEGTNLYYLDSRSRTAISLTTTGNSGAATYSSVSGIINIPQYTLSGLGGVPTTRQLTINGTAFDLSADRSWNVGTVTSVGLNSTTSGVTITNTPVTSSGALTINIATASGSQNGLLSSTDWNSFNTGLGELIVSVAFTPTDLQLTKANSQVIGATVPLANGSQVGFLSTTDYNTFNNKIGGSGTSGQVAYFNGTNSVTGESNLFWDAANDRLGIGVSVPLYRLDVSTVGGSAATARLLGNDQANTRLRIENAGSGGRTWEIVGGLPGANNANFSIFDVTASATRATIDSSGNLGLGVTPSAWNDGFVGFEIKNSANNLSANGGSYFEISQNAVWNSGWKYVNSQAATRYEQGLGGHFWFNAPSGTAGNAISFTQAMTLDASGRLLVGFTTNQTGAALQVSGNGTFAGSVRAANTGFGETGGFIINNRADAASRSWRLANDLEVFADFGIQQSTTQTGSTYATRLYINNTGNVGIGTSSPKSVSSGLSLTIGDGATQHQPYLALARNALGGWWGGIRWYDGDTIKSVIQEDADFNLRVSTSNTERMRITSGGNVLIGTTTDNGNRFQVSGNAFVNTTNGQIRLYTNGSNPSVNIRANTGNSAILAFTQEAVADRWSIGTKSGDAALYFSTGDALSSTQAVLSSSGNLAVNGTIQTGNIGGSGNGPTWKLGNTAAGTLTPTLSINVEINGTTYVIGAATV